MEERGVECCEEFCAHKAVLDEVREKLPDVEELYDLAELFKVFLCKRFSLCNAVPAHFRTVKRKCLFPIDIDQSAPSRKLFYLCYNLFHNLSCI